MQPFKGHRRVSKSATERNCNRPKIRDDKLDHEKLESKEGLFDDCCDERAREGTNEPGLDKRAMEGTNEPGRRRTSQGGDERARAGTNEPVWG